MCRDGSLPSGDLPALNFRMSRNKYKFLKDLAENFASGSDSSAEQFVIDMTSSSTLADWFAVDRGVMMESKRINTKIESNTNDSDETWFSVRSMDDENSDTRTRLRRLETELYSSRRHQMDLKRTTHNLQDADAIDDDAAVLEFYEADMVKVEAKIASLEKEIDELRLVASLDSVSYWTV